MQTGAPPPASPRRAQPGKYLAFFLAGEEYGVEILKVHEIIGMLPITRVPRTPAFVRGVVNLRGKVIAVVGLRERFGMSADGAADSCIIVAQVRGIPVGLVVDTVSEVLTIAPADIEPTPALGLDVATDYLLGVAKGDGRVRLLLDIDRVLDACELEHVHAGATDAATEARA